MRPQESSSSVNMADEPWTDLTKETQTSSIHFIANVYCAFTDQYELFLHLLINIYTARWLMQTLIIWYIFMANRIYNQNPKNKTLHIY